MFPPLTDAKNLLLVNSEKRDRERKLNKRLTNPSEDTAADTSQVDEETSKYLGQQIVDAILAHVRQNQRFKQMIKPGLSGKPLIRENETDDRKRAVNKADYHEQVQSLLQKVILDVEKIAEQHVRKRMCNKIDKESKEFLQSLLDVPFESCVKMNQTQEKQKNQKICPASPCCSFEQNSEIDSPKPLRDEVSYKMCQTLKKKRRTLVKLMDDYHRLSELEKNTISVSFTYLKNELDQTNRLIANLTESNNCSPDYPNGETPDDDNETNGVSNVQDNGIESIDQNDYTGGTADYADHVDINDKNDEDDKDDVESGVSQDDESRGKNNGRQHTGGTEETKDGDKPKETPPGKDTDEDLPEDYQVECTSKVTTTTEKPACEVYEFEEDESSTTTTMSSTCPTTTTTSKRPTTTLEPGFEGVSEKVSAPQSFNLMPTFKPTSKDSKDVTASKADPIRTDSGKTSEETEKHKMEDNRLDTLDYSVTLDRPELPEQKDSTYSSMAEIPLGFDGSVGTDAEPSNTVDYSFFQLNSGKDSSQLELEKSLNQRDNEILKKSFYPREDNDLYLGLAPKVSSKKYERKV
ncbi:hypothetical protein RUM44_006607 [Polyplax serrata]|uniref:Uncharacterized protein n=1 Tax=Polyplax serrata TaxID=468196 RepID=A0ABR1AIK2_POLSC